MKKKSIELTKEQRARLEEVIKKGQVRPPSSNGTKNGSDAKLVVTSSALMRK